MLPAKTARLLLFTGTMVFLLLSSCKHDPELYGPQDPGNGDTNNPNTSQCSPDTVYFQQAILPVLRSGCAMSGCHDAETHEEDIVLDSYASIMATGGINVSNPSKSKIYRQMTKTDEDRMPPAPADPMSADQLSKILKWISQGAKNNSCIESGCDTTNVAYSTHIKPLIANNCKGCHSGSNAGGNVDLTMYSGLKAIADDGRLVGVIDQLNGYIPMPKNGKLTDCQIRMIKIWMGMGAPEN